MKTRCILVVDDDAGSRKLAADILSSSAFRVVVADSGTTGIELAHRERPDLALLDIRLPDTTGYAVLQELRSIPELHSIPVVAVTASAMSGDRERAIGLGFDAYLSKPYRFRELLLLVKQVLETPDEM